MAQKFCTACGAVLSDEQKFCENCGSPRDPGAAAPADHPENPSLQIPGATPADLPSQAGSRRNTLIAGAGILLLVIIIAGAGLFVLPGLSASNGPGGILTGQATPEVTAIPQTVAVPPSPAVVTTRTPEPEPFPDALALKTPFTFGSGELVSEATVYRYWINDTYEWHSDIDNRYYVEKPRKGHKFLFVFVQMQNKGSYRIWFPPAGNIVVWYRGASYTEDQDHYKPDKAFDEDATPIEVKEVMYFQKLNGDEYAEDFGFSHGTELAYLYPGSSNAVDGYIIYEVPESLTPEETYVAISFNAQDKAMWKLA